MIVVDQKIKMPRVLMVSSGGTSINLVYRIINEPIVLDPINITASKKEILLIVGSEMHSHTKGNKLRFPAQAVRQIKVNYSAEPYVTIAILLKNIYTSEEILEIVKAARATNPKVKLVKLVYSAIDKLYKFKDDRSYQK